MLSGIRHDLRLELMKFCIQYLVRNTAPCEHFAQLLTRLDRDGAYQYRLSCLMRFLHGIHNRVQLFLFGLIYTVLIVDTDHWTVCRHYDNIHAVDIPKLLLLRERCTCHTALFVKLIKKVLKCDGCKRLALTLNFDVLFCLNCLMQAVRIAASRHDSPCKFIHDQYLIVLHHVILIAEHEIVRPQRQDNIVLYLKVFGVCKIFYLEKFLHALNARRCKIYHLILLIDDKVPCLLLLYAHDEVHLGHLGNVLAALHLSGENVTDFVELGRLAALTGNDQRRSGFVNKDGVHLVDNGIVQIPQHQLFFVYDHIVTEVIKAKLIVGDISDITIVCLPPLVRLHVI